MTKPDPIIDRSESQKLLRVEKLRAELGGILRQSVPTEELQSYYEAGWAYVMPNFDKPGHSFVDWLSPKMPVYPSRSDQQTTVSASHDHRR